VNVSCKEPVKALKKKGRRKSVLSSRTRLFRNRHQRNEPYEYLHRRLGEQQADWRRDNGPKRLQASDLQRSDL